MKLLLDTHIFLWYILDDVRLKESHRNAIRDPNNTVYLSVVSVWEASIKNAIGKLKLPSSAGEFLPVERERHRIESLYLVEPSVMELGSLPSFHQDPFDRMLVCQSRFHELTIVTDDPVVKRYPAKFL